VDWSQLPVVNVSRLEVEAYAAWVARRLPGTRLCTDREWEKAARGADARRFPSATAITSPDDACTAHGLTRRTWSCEVGTHPASRSPFGADDLMGNVMEWTSGSPDRAEPNDAITRGGGWTDDGIPLRIDNRGLVAPTYKSRIYGVRLCAPAPADAP
jgi:formylglycine-generating enzyme required for sulfatase activity